MSGGKCLTLFALAMALVASFGAHAGQAIFNLKIRGKLTDNNGKPLIQKYVVLRVTYRYKNSFGAQNGTLIVRTWTNATGQIRSDQVAHKVGEEGVVTDIGELNRSFKTYASVMGLYDARLLPNGLVSEVKLLLEDEPIDPSKKEIMTTPWGARCLGDADASCEVKHPTFRVDIQKAFDLNS